MGASNRLNVAFAPLRSLGLREALLHMEGEWRLDSAWTVLRVRVEPNG